MCAIIDNDVSHQAFGRRKTPAGMFFLKRLNKRKVGALVAGGKLFSELSQNAEFSSVFNGMVQAGRARRIPDKDVDAEEDAIRAEGVHMKSNDIHVLALARVSGARLLFTNDGNLQDDFRDRRIIRGTQGRVYNTQDPYHTVTKTHRALLNRTDLCQG